MIKYKLESFVIYTKKYLTKLFCCTIIDLQNSKGDLFMHKNSHSKMEWFKNTYLSTSSKLNILDVGSLDRKGDFNYSDIFKR